MDSKGLKSGYSGRFATTTARTGVLAPKKHYVPLAYFAPMLALCWAVLGTCSAMMGRCWARVGFYVEPKFGNLADCRSL